MSEIVEQAKQVQKATFKALYGVDELVKNPMMRMIPGSEKLPEIVDLLGQAAGVLLVLAKEVEKLKGVNDGEK